MRRGKQRPWSSGTAERNGARRAGICILLAMCVTLPGATHAYILPADFIVRELAEARRQMHILDLSAQLTAELGGGDKNIAERIYLKHPERLRWVQQNDTNHVYVEREHNCARGPEGKPMSPAGPSTDLLATLLMPKGDDADATQKRMLLALRALGIDLAIVTLSRFNHQPVYIVGAQPWQHDVNQVWFDKTTFMPVRYVVIMRDAQGNPRRMETRLLEYASEITGRAFPRIIENYVDDTLTRRAEVIKLQLNTGLPETLFDLPAAPRR